MRLAQNDIAAQPGAASVCLEKPDRGTYRETAVPGAEHRECGPEPVSIAAGFGARSVAGPWQPLKWLRATHKLHRKATNGIDDSQANPQDMLVVNSRQ